MFKLNSTLKKLQEQIINTLMASYLDLILKIKFNF